MALATGRAEIGERTMGDVIDRAVRRVDDEPEDDIEIFPKDGASGARTHRDATPPHGDTVWLDEVTAGLLGAEFSVVGRASGLELTGERPAAEVQVRTLLGRPTPCVGRERELAQLDALLAQVESDPVARAVLVTAPAGVGKSRVRYEWLERVASRPSRVQIWNCRADPTSAGSPFAMLAQLVQQAASIDPSEPVETSRVRLRARLSRHLPRADVQGVADFLGEMIGVRFPDGERVQLRAARQDPMLMGDQMRRAWEAWLLAECDEGRPLLIVLEDLHWGDLPTVRFVDFALRALAERPLMILALARPEVSDLFPELWQGRRDELCLHELTPKAGAKLARHVLGDAVPEEQIQRIVTRAAGNAFFLEEIVRAVAEGRGDADVPETVLAMVQRRIEGFEPDARRVLRAASIFGDTFWRGAAISLLGGATNPVTQVGDWLSKLVDREVIGRRSATRFAGEDEFVFRHAIVRDAAYGMLTDEDRLLGHRLAAEWLERHAERDATALAEHFERGLELERAVPYYHRATAQALEANELSVVISRAECGVRCGARGEVLGDLRRMQAEAMRWRGLIAEAEEAGQEAVALLAPASPSWFSALAEPAAAAGGLAHVEVLLSARDRLLAAKPAGFDAAYAVALSRTVGPLYVAGQRELADAMVAEAETVDRREAPRNPIVFARLEQALGARALHSSDQGTYYERTKVAHELFETAGDRRNACVTAVNMGYVAITVGAYEEAEDVLVPALKVAELLGITRIRAIFLQNLGWLRHLQGRHAESIALQRPAIEAFAAQGDRRLGAGSHYYLSMALDAEGKGEEALESARTAALVGAPFPPMYAITLAGLADLELHGVRKEQALGHAQEAFEILQNLGGLEDGESGVRLSYAEALVAVGRREDAKVALRAACNGIHERASKITNARWRESYLQRIPEHTRTFALARDLGVATS
ncbi:MAG TPA: AAA family ATPase [Polyangiaceae bacterium]